MRNLRRVAVALVGGLALLAAVAYFGLQAYLASGSARGQVAAQISAKIGADVRVTSLGSGAGGTVVGVELAGVGDEPLVAGTVRVDATPVGLALGRKIRVITVEDATLTLHLNEKNDLLDPLPKPPPGSGGTVPDIRIVGAAVRIVQAGKPDFRLAGVDVTITDAGQTLTITGQVADPAYGAWTVAGEWAADGTTGAVALTSDGPVPLTPATLTPLPFVPKETWDSVELAGTGPVKVSVGRLRSGWTWHVEADPADARLTVAPVGGLVVTGTSGRVVVDGPTVTLSGVRGTTAGGTLDLDAVLAFGPTPARLAFTVKAAGLDIKRVPAKWGLANRLDAGTLSGDGSVTLLLAGGRVTPTESKGRATLKGKLFGGQAELDVVPELAGDQLRFGGGPTDAPPKTSHQFLTPERPGTRTPGKTATASVAGRYGVWAAVPALVLLQAPAPPPPPVAAPKPAAGPQYLRANLKLRDVDLAELLARANVSAGVKLAGKVTLDVAADIPTTATGTLKEYRATGTVSTPTLQIEQLTLTGVTANVELKDGVLTLTKLAAAFPADPAAGPGGAPPGFAGRAAFGLDPRTDLTANLTLDRVPLGQVFAAIPGLAGKATGDISGGFDLRIPGDKLGDLAGYAAGGKLTSAKLTVYGQTAEKVAATFALKAGVVSLTGATADAYAGTITGTAALPVTGAAAGAFRVTFRDVDSAALTRAIPDAPVTLAGKFGGTLAGTLPSAAAFDAAKVTGDLDLDAPRLIVQGVPTTKLKGKLGYTPGAVTYDLKGDAFGGTFDVEGAYPLTTTGGGANPAGAKPSAGVLRLTRLRLDQVSRELRLASLRPLRGVLTATLDYTLDDAGRPAGTGRIELRGLGWGDTRSTADLATPVRLTADGIDLPAVAGDFAGGTLRGRVEYPFAAGRRRLATVTLTNADAAALAAPFGLTGVAGRVTVRAYSRLGADLRGGGTVTASRATVAGVEVADLRLPVSWTGTVGRAGLVGQLTARDIAATVATGRVTGRVEATVRDAARIDGRVEFVGVNLAALAAANGQSSFGVGRATGRLDLGGPAVRTAADLTGTLTAQLGDTTAAELPLIGSAATLLTPAQALTRFDRGDVTARLGGGVVRVERLSLTNPSGAKLFADGTVGLTGRLDLDVVYTTGTVGPTSPVLRTVARNIPAIGPVPVGLIVRVTEALSNRVVRITVGGTTARPAYSLNAARLLTENAVRFFVGQYVPGEVSGR